MWYIFPQLKTLGFSDKAIKYGIEDINEAKAYMKEPYLRNNLITITKSLLKLESNDPLEVMGYPDNLKLCSSMTLFEIAAPDVLEFGLVIQKFYQGTRDKKTLNILNKNN